MKKIKYLSEIVRGIHWSFFIKKNKRKVIVMMQKRD
jgi:hypothetical protein